MMQVKSYNREITDPIRNKLVCLLYLFLGHAAQGFSFLFHLASLYHVFVQEMVRLFCNDNLPITAGIRLMRFEYLD